jgi:protein TonB
VCLHGLVFLVLVAFVKTTRGAGEQAYGVAAAPPRVSVRPSVAVPPSPVEAEAPPLRPEETEPVAPPAPLPEPTPWIVEIEPAPVDRVTELSDAPIPRPQPARAVAKAEPVVADTPPPSPPKRAAPKAAQAPAAAAPSAKGTVGARVLERVAPVVPRRCRRRGHGGVAEVALTVGADGVGVGFRIVRSAGCGELDEAALDAAGGFRFAPATRAGRPVASVERIRFRFLAG